CSERCGGRTCGPNSPGSCPYRRPHWPACSRRRGAACAGGFSYQSPQPEPRVRQLPEAPGRKRCPALAHKDGGRSRRVLFMHSSQAISMGNGHVRYWPKADIRRSERDVSAKCPLLDVKRTADYGLTQAAIDMKAPTRSDAMRIDPSGIHMPLVRLPIALIWPKIGSRKQFLRGRNEEVGVHHAAWCAGRHNMKKIVVAAVAIWCVPSATLAGERVGDAGLGALSGAVVLGPVGAVAGAVIGYTAGPSIADSWGLRRFEPRQSAKLPPKTTSKRVSSTQINPPADPRRG